jgi:hypothetical protein
MWFGLKKMFLKLHSSTNVAASPDCSNYTFLPNLWLLVLLIHFTTTSCAKKIVRKAGCGVTLKNAAAASNKKSRKKFTALVLLHVLVIG